MMGQPTKTTGFTGLGLLSEEGTPQFECPYCAHQWQAEARTSHTQVSQTS